ncbi:MAG: copper resistance D family protein, partial [Candidatus Rokuibacteriota bacterium]
YVTTGLPGAARLSRLVGEGLALALAIGGSRLIGIPVAAVLVALAAAGHAAAVRPVWWGVAADAVHLASAGLWAGGILALAMVRPPGGWRTPEARRLLDRFSPVALAAFLATIGAGVLRGFQELGDLGDLVTSSYGRVLGLKVLAVTGMVPLSILAWRGLARSLRLEAAVAVVVIGAAALLAAYPLPPARLGEAEAARAPGSSVSALPRDGDLTLADNAGETLVGLTLRPGTPGPNQVLVYLLPLEGEEAAAGVLAELSVNGHPMGLTQCGATCRKTEVELLGGERVDISVDGPAGGAAAFTLPSLPAPDGTTLFAGARDRMLDLRTLRVEETLSSGRATVRVTYAFQAPDRMAIDADAGFQSILVGGFRYRRDGPDDPWTKERALTPAKVPLFIWDAQRIVAPRVLGEEQVQGRATMVVSFFGPAGETPIWHRLWVNPSGLVLQAGMRAQGHFMHHRYDAFDSDLRIEAPEGAP